VARFSFVAAARVFEDYNAHSNANNLGDFASLFAGVRYGQVVRDRFPMMPRCLDACLCDRGNSASDFYCASSQHFKAENDTRARESLARSSPSPILIAVKHAREVKLIDDEASIIELANHDAHST